MKSEKIESVNNITIPNAKVGKNYQEFPCDLCGHPDAAEIPHVREYTGDQPIHICKQCGLVYVKFRRSAQDIADAWSNEIFGDGYTAKIPAVRARQLYVADSINANIDLKGKEVCDIGAGEGPFLDMLRNEEYGAHVFGIEPSQKNCAELSKMGIRNFCGTIEDYCADPESNKYKSDITTIIWTLENCRLCRDMLLGAYKILKDGGHVVIATGSRILVPFKKPLHLYFGPESQDTNTFRFSANTLRGILAVCGFEVTSVNKYIDSDVLCMIAKKRERGAKIEWKGDDFSKVYNFFERWHKETLFYKEGNQ